MILCQIVAKIYAGIYTSIGDEIIQVIIFTIDTAAHQNGTLLLAYTFLF